MHVLLLLLLLLVGAIATAHQVEITHATIKQALQFDRLDASLAYVEQLLGHPILNVDACIEKTLAAVDDPKVTDEGLLGIIQSACGVSLCDLPLGSELVPQSNDGNRLLTSTSWVGFGAAVLSAPRSTRALAGPQIATTQCPSICRVINCGR